MVAVIKVLRVLKQIFITQFLSFTFLIIAVLGVVHLESIQPAKEGINALSGVLIMLGIIGTIFMSVGILMLIIF